MNKAHAKWYLFVILLIALILRTISSANLEVGHDEMIYSTRGINFISSGQLSTIDQSPLYFYTLDMVFKIFGYSVWSFRILDIIAAGLTLLVIFLIGKELYSEKVGLLAAFLFGVSPFAIRWNVEMNPISTALLALSVLCFIKGLRNPKYFYLSTLSLGIAVLFKPIPILIIPVFLILAIKWTPRPGKLKFALWCGGILGLTLLPLMAHNYLAFTQKGALDFWTAQALNIQVTELSAFGSGSTGFFELSPSGFLLKLKQIIWTLGKLDPITFLLSFLGLLFLQRKRANKFLYLILVSLIGFFAYINVTGGNHILFLIPFLAVAGANMLNQVMKKLTVTMVIILLLAVFLLNIWLIAGFLIQETPHADLRTYAIEEIPNEALVVVDSRIVRFVYGWAFHDKNYVSTAHYLQLDMGQFINSNPNAHVPIFFFSCAPLECGMKLGGKQFREAAKATADSLKRNLILDHTFKKNDNEKYIEVYKGEASVNTNTYEHLKFRRFLYFYPTYWNHNNFFDKYTAKTYPEHIVYFVGRTTLHVAFIFFLLILLYPLWLLKESLNIP